MIIRTAIFLCALAAGSAQAALQDRGGGLIYDTDLDITWLSDANYAMTSGYDSDGLMNWSEATAWAAGLAYGGYTDWRLPTTLQPDPTCSNQGGLGSGYGGVNCTGSDMGHLFYTELGGTGFTTSILTSLDPDLAKFTNIQSNFYWSGSDYAPNAPYSAWYFYLYYGYQSNYTKGESLYALAVRPGDVAAIPEPETYAMFLAGLGLIAATVRSCKIRNNSIRTS